MKKEVQVRGGFRMKLSKRHYDSYAVDHYSNHLNYISPRKPASLKIEPIEKEGIVDQVFKSRLDAVRITLFDILYEIQNRSALDESLTNRVNDDICRLKTQLFELENWQTGSNNAVDNRRGAIEDKIHDLERELRHRDIKRWQDVSMLKKELRDTFREYSDIARKLKIVGMDRNSRE